MATKYKEVNYSLSHLIDQIDLGSIGLPDIQRPFIWKDTKVRDLFDSMYRGYPVGYFLFWANQMVDNTREIGASGKQKHPDLLIVDGQQRLTSLYAVMKGHPIVRSDYQEARIRVAFNPLEETFAIPDASIRRNPRYIHDISQLWHPDSDPYEFMDDFIEQLKKVEEVDRERLKRVRSAIARLQDLSHYPFSALELSPDIDEEQVAEIFVRINAQGKKLNQADFILTLMSVFWDQGRFDLENFCRSAKQPNKHEASAFNYLMEPRPDQMLRVAVGLAFKRARLKFVYSILRGKDLETGKVSVALRDQQFGKLKEAQALTLDIQTWHEFLKGIRQAGFLRADLISSDNTILYSYVLFLIGRHDFKMDWYELRALVAQWFFFASLTGRYTSSPESRMEQDLAELRVISDKRGFVRALQKIMQNALPNDYWSTILPSNLATTSNQSPSQFAFYAALIVLEARGLYAKLPVADLLQQGLRSKKSPMERHHLFPKAYLERQGVRQQRDRNQIANYALVEWSDNIKISDASPQEYVPQYEARFTQAELERMYYWHALPQNWQDMDYRDFLEERRVRIAQVIKEAFEKLGAW